MAEYDNERKGDRTQPQGKKLSEPTLWESCGNECNNLFACKNSNECSCVHPNVCLEYMLANSCTKYEKCENFHPVLCQDSDCSGNCLSFHVTPIEITRWIGKQMDEQANLEKEHEDQTPPQTSFRPRHPTSGRLIPQHTAGRKMRMRIQQPTPQPTHQTPPQSTKTSQLKSELLQKNELFHKLYIQEDVREWELRGIKGKKETELEEFKLLATNPSYLEKLKSLLMNPLDSNLERKYTLEQQVIISDLEVVPLDSKSNLEVYDLEQKEFIKDLDLARTIALYISIRQKEKELENLEDKYNKSKQLTQEYQQVYESVRQQIKRLNYN
jgi:hypothetical protein